MTAIGVVGFVTAISSGFDFRFSPEIRDVARLLHQDNDGFRGKCFLEAPVVEFDQSCIERGEKPLWIVWGDFTAAVLYPGLKEAQDTASFRLARFAAAPACAPILASGHNARCDAINSDVFNFIKSSAPDTILLHAMWGTDSDLSKLKETITQLKALSVPRIVILGPVPTWKRTLPHLLVNYYRFRHILPDRIATGASGPENDRLMEAFSKSVGVAYISAWHSLCNADGCLTRAGPGVEDVITIDIVHLSNAGSLFLIRAIAGQLFHQTSMSGKSPP